jgi:hypothetical protein
MGDIREEMTNKSPPETPIKRTPPYTFLCDCCGMQQIALSFSEGDIYYISFLLTKEKDMLESFISDPQESDEDDKKEYERDLRIVKTLIKKIEDIHLEK